MLAAEEQFLEGVNELLKRDNFRSQTDSDADRETAACLRGIGPPANGSTLLTWRALAKDGMDLPPDQSVEGPAEIQMGNGETYDFDFVPPGPGDFRIDVTNAAGGLLASMPGHVR